MSDSPNTSTLEFQARNVQWLEFELSNQCHYTHAHQWCPRGRLGNTPLVQLQTEVIEKTLSFFKDYDYSGSVYFSIYNEPLMDARILDLIRMAKRILPQCFVQMFTNGVLLTNELAAQLGDAGLGRLMISIYPEAPPRDYAEIIATAHNHNLHAFTVGRGGYVPYSGDGWDERAGIYDRIIGDRSPCYMPIQYFLINCHGDVMMCWDDWKTTVSFGNVYRDSIADILISPKRLHILSELKLGHRDGVCVGCGRPTTLCLQEYWTRLRL